jgi:hypothetical protein
MNVVPAVGAVATGATVAIVDVTQMSVDPPEY